MAACTGSADCSVLELWRRLSGSLMPVIGRDTLTLESCAAALIS